jgi:hypothetical protein
MLVLLVYHFVIIFMCACMNLCTYCICVSMIIIYLCIIIVLICCLSMYAYYVDIYLLLMDDAWKKEGTPMLC